MVCAPQMRIVPRRNFRYTSTLSSQSAKVSTINSLNLRSKENIGSDSIRASRYRRPTHPTSVPLNKLFSNNFPLTIKESIEDYSYRNNPLKFQNDLLSTLPFYPEADNYGRTSQVVRTKLDSGNEINEFVIYPPNKSESDANNMKHLIMVHGYGAGLGFYIKNFDSLSKVDNWCIHAIDLLGYGCSSRPHFKLEEDNLDSVEKWFHDSFHEWMSKRGLLEVPLDNKIVLAHSMGAYLMATYGIKKDPNFCKELIMVSPGAVIKHRKNVTVPKYFEKLWEQNISPFSLVRMAGPLGSKLVSGWSFRRFDNLSHLESRLLHKYAYIIFQAPGSGEYMLNYLLAPGADARHPLIERGIHKLNCKLLWIYGENDWMDKKGGELCSRITQFYHDNENLSSVVEVENSGHHVYLDNYKLFNKIIEHEMLN